MQLTIKQAAELLQVDEGRVRRWIRDRGLPAVRFNEQYRLNRVDLLAWAQENHVVVAAHAVRPGEPGNASLPTALALGGIHRGLAGDRCDAVLHALLQRLALPAGVDGELLREMVLAREARGTTAIGAGIAIPHARYPIVAGVAAPMLALGFPDAPIALAGAAEPVTALFLLLAPDIRTHLHLLARLARALGSELLAPVQARASDDAILAAARASDDAVDHAAPRRS